MGWPSCWYAEQLIFSGPHLLGVIVLQSVWPSCWYAEQRKFFGPHLLGSIVLLWDGPRVSMLSNIYVFWPSLICKTSMVQAFCIPANTYKQ